MSIVFFVFWVIGLAIGTAAGAVVLRAAVSMYNRLAGGEGVPEPSIRRAMVIMFVVNLVNLAAGFGVGLFIVGAAAAGGAQDRNVVAAAQLAALPVGVIVVAGILSAMLPTTIDRALLVTLCHVLIGLVIVGFFALLGFILF